MIAGESVSQPSVHAPSMTTVSGRPGSPPIPGGVAGRTSENPSSVATSARKRSSRRVSFEDAAADVADVADFASSPSKEYLSQWEADNLAVERQLDGSDDCGDPERGDVVRNARASVASTVEVPFDKSQSQLSAVDSSSSLPAGESFANRIAFLRAQAPESISVFGRLRRRMGNNVPAVPENASCTSFGDLESEGGLRRNTGTTEPDSPGESDRVDLMAGPEGKYRIGHVLFLGGRVRAVVSGIGCSNIDC